MDKVCFYHRKDLDGRCGGAVVKFLTGAETIGIDYGEPFP